MTACRKAARDFLVAVSRTSIHINFMAVAENIGRLGALSR
jgi:hypothetical protein